MYSLKKLFLFFSLFFGGINGIIGSNQFLKPNPKLFVFGDSYADTGNMKHDAKSWKSPYGITYPGKPSGRYSDGLIATDFLAKVLGAKPPYLYRTHGRKNGLKRGMNFAYGKSVVITTPDDPVPNITAQVNILVALIKTGHVYTLKDFTAPAVAVISYSGYDYLEYIANNGLKAIEALVDLVIDQIRYGLWILDGMKFKNVAVTSLQPIGCLPHFTASKSFQSCNESYSKVVQRHNDSLKKVVATLNEEKSQGQQFFIIDFYSAFTTVLNKKGSTKFKTPLKPCCEGDCGRVDTKGAKKYTLCDDPKSAFFWDDFNPTQEGWRSIYSVLGNPISRGL